MHLKPAEPNDFDSAFHYIKELWDYNTYDEAEMREVYKDILNDKNSFAYFLTDDDTYYGFCHGVYFKTFWMSGITCYLSTLIVDPLSRGKGYGKTILDSVKKLAESKDCKCIILDSGLPRKDAHKFYEHYGFEKGCYGFELKL